jgi:cation transport regulator
MLYGSVNELPDTVRHSLPEEAQEVYRDAFNKAYAGTPDHERATQSAWSAVRVKWEEHAEGWRVKPGGEGETYVGGGGTGPRHRDVVPPDSGGMGLDRPGQNDPGPEYPPRDK